MILPRPQVAGSRSSYYRHDKFQVSNGRENFTKITLDQERFPSREQRRKHEGGTPFWLSSCSFSSIEEMGTYMPYLYFLEVFSSSGSERTGVGVCLSVPTMFFLSFLYVIFIFIKPSGLGYEVLLLLLLLFLVLERTFSFVMLGCVQKWELRLR